MVATMLASGQPVTYRKYPGAGHDDVLTASFADTLAWANALFRRR
jgi:acetyl esterase/lipase